MEPQHERIARVARAAGSRYGLALRARAGRRVRGFGSRDGEPAERRHVDLFTSWQHRGEFPELAAAVDVGPVLHAYDDVANKVCALFGRALPRDFLDVDAAITSGRYTREQLLELAAEADRGFDRLLFADALGALTQITDAAFAEYRADPGMVTEMRHRFARWRQELLDVSLG